MQFYLRFILAMGRSPVFGSTTRNLFARLRLAFAAASWCFPLNLATYSKSPDHYAKGTQSGLRISEEIRKPSYSL